MLNCSDVFVFVSGLVVQDGQAMLWDLNEGKHLYTLDGGDTINALCFSPNRYWLCAATGPSIKIWVSSSALRNLAHLYVRLLKRTSTLKYA